MNPAPKTLVIDASVARAAGGMEARYPASIHAREFLKCVYEAGHKIGMTPAVKVEWDKHQSYFSQKWRATMVARKRLVPKQIVENMDIREAIGDLEISDSKKSAMFKDCHLLEAALAFDERIASSDETVRSLFKQASVLIKIIRQIIWVNPIADEVMAEKALRWLREGALNEEYWRLDSRSVMNQRGQ